MNHYSTRLVTHGVDPNLHFNQDAEYVTSVDKSWPSSLASWLVVNIYFIFLQGYWYVNRLFLGST